MLVYSRNVRVLYKTGVAESIFGNKFGTGNRINVLNAHAQTLSSRKSPNIVSRAGNDHVFIGKRVCWIQMWRQILNGK